MPRGNHTYTKLESPKRSVPLTRRLLRYTFCLLLIPTTVLIILSLLTYLSPLRGATRPCLPFSLSRISDTAHRKLSCTPIGSTMSAMRNGSTLFSEEVDGEGSGNRLMDFLVSQKQLFMMDFSAGNLKGWTIVMGNEAGDLDSIASSVAFSFLSSTLQAERVVPLMLTPSTLMHLRPENLLAFRKANNLDPKALLYTDSIPLESESPSALSRLSTMGAKFALVDSNKLLPQFGDGEVVAIIDHHEDEHAHPNVALRLITVPTGSCASLVVKHFRPQWEATMKGPAGQAGSLVPRELATLLLEAGMIDTAGFVAGGKATQNDLDAAEFLLPLSTLVNPSDSNSLTPSAAADAISSTFNELSQAKYDVSTLSTSDLLIRDYKEYILPTSSAVFPTLRAGLSTVPVGLKKWLHKEEHGWDSLLDGIDTYMATKNLDIEGVLTSFDNSEGKHRRELLLVTKTGYALKSNEEAVKVMEELIKGFEASDNLVLVEWENPVKKLLKGKNIDDEAKGRFGKVWKQQKSKATRKQVAPLLREVVSKIQ